MHAIGNMHIPDAMWTTAPGYMAREKKDSHRAGQ